jgi:TonB family protein
MSLSQISKQQRERETKTCRLLLAWALPSSLILHTAILVFGVHLPQNEVQKLAEKPIELVMVEPKPKPVKPPLQKPPEKKEPQKIIPKLQTKKVTRGGDGKKPSPKNIASPPKPAFKIQQPKPIVKNNPVAKLPEPPKPFIRNEPEPKPVPLKPLVPKPEARPLPPLARETKPLPPIRQPNSFTPEPPESPPTDNFSPQPNTNSSNNLENTDRSGNSQLTTGSSGNFSGSEINNTEDGEGGTGGDGSGGKVTCLECSQPEYPDEAREQELEGKVKVSVDIDAEGNVTNAKVDISSGHTELDEAALEKAREWKFTKSQSGKKGMIIAIKFKLEDAS